MNHENLEDESLDREVTDDESWEILLDRDESPVIVNANRGTVHRHPLDPFYQRSVQPHSNTPKLLSRLPRNQGKNVVSSGSLNATPMTA